MNPVAAFIDNLTAGQERRHSWLLKAAEQIRSTRDAERANNAPATD